MGGLEIDRIKLVLRKHVRPLALYGGMAVVVLWTVLRHLTNGINFDVVGQVGLVQQWMQGLHGGAELGPTNYLLKFPLYALVELFGFLSPEIRLLLLALICNLLTYWIIFRVFEKILALYGIASRAWLYLMIIWLATISGAVFWVDYANSRNLEIAGGMLLLYLVLRYLQTSTVRLAIAIGALTSILLFADSLQVFVLALPICAYALLRTVRSRGKEIVRSSGILLVAIGVGYVVSKTLFWLVATVLPIRFLRLPTPLPDLSWHTVWVSLHTTLDATAKIFDADFYRPPFDPNTLRECFNFVIVCAAVFVIIRLLRSKQTVSFPKALFLIILAFNYLAFVASGQALQWETQRYLILVPVMTVLIVALAAPGIAAGTFARTKRYMAAGLVLSALLLVGALAVSWPQRYEKDAFIHATVDFMRSGGYNTAVSSREIGIPATYFADSTVKVLPVICDEKAQLQQSVLFYDGAAFARLADARGDVPILLPADGIRTGGTVCDREAVVAQFGAPRSEVVVPGVGTALLYDGGQLGQLQR